MSDWNSLESELRKWTPRQPSPELRARLFRVPAPKAATVRRLTDFTQWLVPVFGCFLLVVGTLSTRYPAHVVLTFSATNFLAEHGAAYSEMVLASGAEHSDKNALPVPRLEWSFGGRSSTADLVGAPTSYTNKINQ